MIQLLIIFLWQENLMIKKLMINLDAAKKANILNFTESLEGFNTVVGDRELLLEDKAKNFYC